MWKNKPLGEIAILCSGGTPDKKHSEYYTNGTIPWIRSGELNQNVIFDSELKITELGLQKSSAQIFPAGTLLIAMYGASIGKIARLGIDAATNQAVCGIFENSEVSLDYLYYFLLYKKPDLIKCGIGGAQPNISQTILKKVIVSYPTDIMEQQRIVAHIEELFSQLDSGLETLKKAKQQLEVYRKAVITAAFHFEQETEWKRLAEISDISGGITKGRDLSGQETLLLPYLRVANVQDGYLDLSEMKTIELKASEREKYLLTKGDVLYTEGGDRDKLGRGTVWNGEIENCVHQNHIFKARINRDIAIPEYVAYWSMSVPARNYFYDKGKQSVNLASINKTVLSSLELPLPSLEQQAKTVQEIEAALSVCGSIDDTIEKALQQAAAMRQSILKQAFRKMNKMVESILNPYRELVADINPTEFEIFCVKTLEAIAQKDKLQNYSVQHNQKLKVADGEYQVDILITHKIANMEYRTIGECKMYKRPVGRDKVEILYSRMQSVHAQKGVLISTSGFQSGAVEFAREHSICLIQLIEAEVKYITNCAISAEAMREQMEMQFHVQRLLPKYNAYEWNLEYDFPFDIVYPTAQMRCEAQKKAMEQFSSKGE